MKKLALPLLLCAAALSSSAHAGIFGDSSMRPPAAPAADMEEVMITGMGFGRRGNLEFLDARGKYYRGAGRFSLLGYGSNTGDSGFIVESPELGGALQADCHFGQGDLHLGKGISATVRPLSLDCGYRRNGTPIAVDFEVHERGIFQNERRGMMSFEGRELEIRSVHLMKGSKFPSSTPLGYVFLDKGREVGGIDLNRGKKKLMYLPRDPKLREAAIAASLTLAVFWDPQNTVDD